jgi:hypothetical protein
VSCQQYEPPGPQLTTCFAGSRPYDTDFGCSTRPEGPTTAIRLTNGLESSRLNRVLVLVDGNTVFDSNLQLVLSRHAFPIATLPAKANQLLEIKVELRGTGRLGPYRFELRSSHPMGESLAALSVELYHNDSPRFEESLSLRYVETPRSAMAAPNLPAPPPGP